MKKIFMVAAIFMITASTASAGTGIGKAVAESRKMVKEMGMTLKSHLKEAIQTSGFPAAIDVCKTIAPQVAEDLSEKRGAMIHRVSLRLRNSANAPDEVEDNILKQMDRDIEAGILRKEYVAVETDTGGSKILRYMKPIVTQKLCLNCHGPRDKLAPGVADALRENYPDDNATGYGENQVRGAFSVKYPLD